MTTEPYIVQMNWLYTNTPTWWLNFIHSLPLVKSNDVFWAQIAEELVKYNGTLFMELTSKIGRPAVCFDSEADYAWFVLRWS